MDRVALGGSDEVVDLWKVTSRTVRKLDPTTIRVDRLELYWLLSDLGTELPRLVLLLRKIDAIFEVMTPLSRTAEVPGEKVVFTKLCVAGGLTQRIAPRYLITCAIQLIFMVESTEQAFHVESLRRYEKHQWQPQRRTALARRRFAFTAPKSRDGNPQ